MYSLLPLNQSLFDSTKDEWLRQLASMPENFPSGNFTHALKGFAPSSAKQADKSNDYALVSNNQNNIALALLTVTFVHPKAPEGYIKVMSITLNPADSRLGDDSSRFVDVMTEIIVAALNLSEENNINCIKILGTKPEARLFLRVMGGLINRQGGFSKFGLGADTYSSWLELKKNGHTAAV